MKLAISNIAWDPAKDDSLAQLVRAEGLSAVEIAPTLAWDRPTEAEAGDILAYRDAWHARGFSIVALQSLLYGHPELHLFRSKQDREALKTHLQKMITVGARLGASVLVFGSPNARRREPLSVESALEIAVPFFADLAPMAHDAGVALCIEANPPEYGCDFLVSTEEALAFVHAVSHPGVGIHLDAACMYLAGDSPFAAVDAAGRALRHVHISEPWLKPVGDQPEASHSEMAEALHGSGYEGHASIEMRAVDGADQAATIQRAIRYARGVYG